VASFLGDLVTLAFLGIVSSFLIIFISTPIPLILTCAIVALALFSFVYTLRNPLVRPLLKQGWSPLFIAMAISIATGIVLDRFVSRYQGFALLAVVISGLPGSVGSIFVSRLSTKLHVEALSSTPHTRRSTTREESYGGPPQPSEKLVMLTLLLITLPVEIIFLALLNGLGWLRLPLLFVLMSVFFFFIAVSASCIIPYSPF
jgi:solute carrier family 41